MTCIAYFDCFSGVSGDMFLGALIDAGLDPQALEAELRKLALSEEWSLRVETVRRQGIAGAQVQFLWDGRPLDEPPSPPDPAGSTSKHGHTHSHAHSHSHGPETPGHHPHRHLPEIRALLESSRLDPTDQERAMQIFDRLAEAEARAHRISKEAVHFHEVGALDAILDVVGAAVAVRLMKLDRIVASPLPVGRGFVRCAHGTMPLPAPGTIELLKGVPIVPSPITAELITPTGAAILTTLAESFGPIPEMVVESVGYGAGARDLEEQPNLLRVLIGSKKKRQGS